MLHPPMVHALDGEHIADTRLTVYSTARRCYELIAEFCTPDSVTLETGCGLSTALLGLIGSSHTSVVAYASEAERLLKHMQEQSIPTDSVTFAHGWSDEVLPRMEPTPLDLVFIDGGHGFPTPILDWYYAGGRLRVGGLLILDDVSLPAVALLVDVLKQDPRWRTVEGDGKWLALERLAGGSLREDWFRQPHLKPARSLRRRISGRLRRAQAVLTSSGGPAARGGA